MSKVKYIKHPTKNQLKGGYYDNPIKLLKIGRVYEIERIEVYSWYTWIFLKKYPDLHFNYIWFEDINGVIGKTILDKVRKVHGL